MTGKEMLKMWLIGNAGIELTEGLIETKVYQDQWKFGLHYEPGTLSRYFRDVRDNLGKFTCREVENRKYKTWIVV